MKVKYFKATKNTRRFNSNQKIFIQLEDHNHLYIRFKWRGRGRYVNGIIDRFSPVVGEIKEIEVNDEFGKRITEIHPGRYP